MKALPLHIVPMQSSHVDACAALMGRIELFQRYQVTEEAARRSFLVGLDDRRADLRVALSQEKVAGFYWFVRRGAFDRDGYLRLIAVDNQFQGRGVGQTLMHALEEAYRGDRGMFLLASADNHPAHRFYEKLGYQMVGELPDYVKPGFRERIYFKILVQ